MSRLRAGAASIHDPRGGRAEDRVLAGEHAWAILTGTVNAIDAENEADAAAPIADAFVTSGAPPSLDAMQECLFATDRAVVAWSRASPLALDALGRGLEAILLVVSAGVAHVAHVGTSRGYLLSQSSDDAPLVTERLTLDHTLDDLVPRRSDRVGGASPSARAIVLSSLGAGRVPRIDFTRVALAAGTRVVLVSPGAHLGLDTPLGYLRGMRAPADLAQRICVEARSRAGARPRHASAIVVDVDVESGTGPYR